MAMGRMPRELAPPAFQIGISVHDRRRDFSAPSNLPLHRSWMTAARPDFASALLEFAISCRCEPVQPEGPGADPLLTRCLSTRNIAAASIATIAAALFLGIGSIASVAVGWSARSCSTVSALMGAEDSCSS